MEEDQAAMGNSDDSDVLILPIKRKKFTKTGGNGGKTGVKPVTPPVIVVAKRVTKPKPKFNGEMGSKGSVEESGSALDAPILKKKLLQLKNTPDGRSIAATKVKKRKIYKVDKVEEKDAGQPETKMKQQPTSASTQSVAATRVKKRKVNEREMMTMEPPLKRLKFLSARAKESMTESPLKGKGKEKEQVSSPKRGRPSKAKGIKWPPKVKIGEGRQKVSSWRVFM
jgi:hypothetical protein